jgi:hypothetical protein
MFVLKNHKTPRFDVDYKQRLKQSRTATNAVRLPRLGYAQYRVYDIEKKKDKTALNLTYGQHIGRGLRTGPISIVYSHKVNLKWLLIDESISAEPLYQVKWLKPKQATLLRLQGHRVEKI